MRYLVTGGAGFIGSHLTERLLAEGHEVTVFDRAVSRNLDGVKRHERFHFEEGDIRKPEDVERAISPGTDGVFHLSAIVGVKHYVTDPIGVLDVNVGGTRNVLATCAKRGAKLLFTSTSEVYGKNPKIPWSEEDDRVLGPTTNHRWSYSASKGVGEHLVLGMLKGGHVRATIVRYFNVYGPRQNPELVVSQSVYRALRGEKPLLFDGGRQTRCFTYIDDAIEGTMRAMFDPKGEGEVFNIGNSRETTVREVIELVIKHARTVDAWEAVETATHYGKGFEDIERRVPDVSKAKRVLGWEVNVQADEGVRRTIEWARQNPWYLGR